MLLSVSDILDRIFQRAFKSLFHRKAYFVKIQLVIKGQSTISRSDVRIKNQLELANAKPREKKTAGKIENNLKLNYD